MYPLWTVAVDPQDGCLYVGRKDIGLVYSSQDNGATWYESELLGFDGVSVIRIMPGDEQEVYCGLIEGGLFRSTDKGKTWNLVENGLPEKLCITDLLIAPAYKLMILADWEKGLFVSKNGHPWVWALIGRRIYSLVMPPNSDGRLHAAGWGIHMHSNDSGSTWNDQENTSFVICRLIVNEETPNIWYAATFYQGFYKSIDGGTTWNLSNTGLPGWGYNRDICLAVHPSSANVLFLGLGSGHTGLYSSKDGGNTWQDVSDNLVDMHVYGIAFTADGSMVYAATNKGLFKRTYSCQ